MEVKLTIMVGNRDIMNHHKAKKLFLLSIVFTTFALFIMQVQMVQAVDLSEMPQRLGDNLNMSLLAGQMLLSSLILALFLFPTMLLTKRSGQQGLAVIIMSFMVMGSLVAFGWLPIWFLLVTALIIALLFAGKMRGFISGQ